jgi:hypothetical protein
MAKTTDDNGGAKCPICELCDCLSEKGKEFRASDFAKHLRNAQTEVLMAIRSAIDDRIEAIKKEHTGGEKTGARRIKVKGGE